MYNNKYWFEPILIAVIVVGLKIEFHNSQINKESYLLTEIVVNIALQDTRTIIECLSQVLESNIADVIDRESFGNSCGTIKPFVYQLIKTQTIVDWKM